MPLLASFTYSVSNASANWPQLPGRLEFRFSEKLNRLDVEGKQRPGLEQPENAPELDGFVMAEFTMIGWTNVGALRLPAEFELRRYIPVKDYQQTLFEHYIARVTNAATIATLDPVPPIPESVQVDDYRRRSDPFFQYPAITH